MPKQEIIYIDGYWLDAKAKKGGNTTSPKVIYVKGKEFVGSKCIIGEWDGNENDHDIFYYFEDEEDIKHMMKKENCGSEFVVTKYYR